MNMSTCRSAYNQSVPILCQRSAQTFKVFHPQVQICQIPTVPHLEEEYLEISMGQQVVGPLHLCPHIIMPICRSIRTHFPLQEMMTKDILANSIGILLRFDFTRKKKNNLFFTETTVYRVKTIKEYEF